MSFEILFQFAFAVIIITIALAVANHFYKTALYEAIRFRMQKWRRRNVSFVVWYTMATWHHDFVNKPEANYSENFFFEIRFYPYRLKQFEIVVEGSRFCINNATTHNYYQTVLNAVMELQVQEPSELIKVSQIELNEQLREAIDKEDYMKAAMLRDKIKR